MMQCNNAEHPAVTYLHLFWTSKSALNHLLCLVTKNISTLCVMHRNNNELVSSVQEDGVKEC